MSIRHRLTALLVGLVLMQPAHAAHEDHCSSPEAAAQQAPGHHDETQAPDATDCDHAAMDACATMTSCAAQTAEPQHRASTVPPVASAVASARCLAPTFRTSAPETPPPRA